jgi:hypothetical protein
MTNWWICGCWFTLAINLGPNFRQNSLPTTLQGGMWTFTALAHMHLPPFEQLIEQQMVQLQDSILEHLHHHTFSNIISNRISEAHYAWILSYFGPGVGAWLTIWLIFPAFWWSSLILFIAFRMQFGSPLPLNPLLMVLVK